MKQKGTKRRRLYFKYIIYIYIYIYIYFTREKNKPGRTGTLTRTTTTSRFVFDVQFFIDADPGHEIVCSTTFSEKDLCPSSPAISMDALWKSMIDQRSLSEDTRRHSRRGELTYDQSGHRHDSPSLPFETRRPPKENRPYDSTENRDTRNDPCNNDSWGNTPQRTAIVTTRDKLSACCSVGVHLRSACDDDKTLSCKRHADLSIYLWTREKKI